MSQPAIQYKLFGPGKQQHTLPAPLEREEQKALMQWIEYQGRRDYPELEFCFHVPNGGRREKREAKHLQEQGVKAGVPDLILPVARGSFAIWTAESRIVRLPGYHGLYIEMKRRGEKPSAEQKRWHDFLRAQGYCVTVCESMEESRYVLIAYMEMGRC